ncbi:MAG: DUF4271 domain-containing protein [Bacteroidota bacterium]
MKTDTSGLNFILKDSIREKSPSLFQDHLLSPKNKHPQIHYTDYDFGFAAIIFFLYVLYIWLYVSNRKRLTQIIKGFYINHYANQLAREEMILGNRVSVFLGVLFVFTITLFFIQVNEYYGLVVGNTFLLFTIIALSIALVYGIKLAFIRLIGFVFKMNKEANEYRMSIFLFGNALGLFMFPVVICLAFVKQASPRIFIYIGLSIILIFLFMRLVRGLVIGLNSQRVSKFYLFLYLCTLEILPFVIAIKLFLLNIK